MFRAYSFKDVEMMTCIIFMFLKKNFFLICLTEFNFFFMFRRSINTLLSFTPKL